MEKCFKNTNCISTFYPDAKHLAFWHCRHFWVSFRHNDVLPPIPREDGSCADFVWSLPQGWDTLIGEKGFGLSEGQAQRIAIARALLNDPEVIIADEPTGNLDNETADGIMKLLTGINKDKGTAIVMVTHNRQIFEKYQGRVMVCKDENCIEQKDEDIIDLELTI